MGTALNWWIFQRLLVDGFNMFQALRAKTSSLAGLNL